MKTKYYILIIALLVAVGGLVIYMSQSADDKIETVSQPIENHEGHAHNTTMKRVTLNDAQLRHAEIEFGTFKMKNLSEVIHANGYTKLPPQNRADVNTYAEGLVKSIKVIEGQAVNKGDVLAVIESPQFAKKQQEYLISKSKLAYLELEFERQQALVEADVNAKKVFEKTTAELAAERATYNAVKEELKILGIDPNGPTVSSVYIRAPFTGNVTNVYVNIGSSARVGTPLFSLVDNSEMHVDLMIYEKDLYKIEKGQKVRFVLTNQSNKEIDGTIFNIGKAFENETKTVAVHAHIENSDIELIPGMYVNALIDIGLNEVKTLPEEAVVEAEGRSFIFVKSKDGHQHKGNNEFVRVEVSTGAHQLGSVEVVPVQKLPKNGEIVVNGAYYLQSHLQKSESGGEHSH